MTIEHVAGTGAAGAATEAPVTREAAGADAGAPAAVVAASVQYYPVAPGYRLNVRSGPGTGYAVVRVLAEGARVPIHCQRTGTTVTGPYGTSRLWDNIADGQYVSDAYVRTGSDGYVAPRCG